MVLLPAEIPEIQLCSELLLFLLLLPDLLVGIVSLHDRSSLLQEYVMPIRIGDSFWSRVKVLSLLRR